MRSTAICILFVLLICVAEFAHGAIMHEELKTEEVHGRIVKYCEHEGVRYLRGTKVRFYDGCTTCTCDNTGLTCYTMIPLLMEPEEESKCTYIIVGCRVRWVLKKDNSRRCPKRLIPEHFF